LRRVAAPRPASIAAPVQEIVFDAVADGALSIPSELYAATWKYQVATARPSTT
jgi:hypothetical protein